MMAAVAAVAIGATAGTATLSGIFPAHAEAVRVETAQAPGFADVVEKVSPAVVSVRVKTDVQPVDNQGFSFNLPGMPGFDDLPQDHPLNRFFREFRGNGGDRDFRNRDERGKRAERLGNPASGRRPVAWSTPSRRCWPSWPPSAEPRRRP